MHGVTDSIEFQMSPLLFTTTGGYQVAARIAQPAVVGIMLAGIVIGPSILSWVIYTVGEVAMIIALLALNEKILGQTIYVSLVMMSLLTILIVPLFLKNWVFTEDH